VNIPHFRQTIIMAFKCDHCGYKSTEIQTGGEVPERGKRITLRVESDADLKRDVLKSNSESLEVPELELELVSGTLGGFFTTIEGLLTQVYDNLRGTPITEFSSYGDSAAAANAAAETAEPGRGVRMQTSMGLWLQRLRDAIDGKCYPFTIVLDDPMAAIYVQNPRAHLPPPENLDPQIVEENYVRTWEQDEDMGLHHMVV
jgi:zinc finger protein